MTCEYCGSSIQLGVDHVIPVSTMFSGRRSGTMKSYGDTVICRRECNSLLGNKHYHTRHSRALYLVERYANRLQHYADDDQVYILDKLKTCMINYESFLLSHIDVKSKDREVAEEVENETSEIEVSAPEDDPDGESPQIKAIRKKGAVELIELVGLTLSDIKDIDGSVHIIDFFAKPMNGSHILGGSLIRKLRKSNTGSLANFRDQTFRSNPDVFSVLTKAKLSEDDGQLFFVALTLHGDLPLEMRREIHKLANWFS